MFDSNVREKALEKTEKLNSLSFRLQLFRMPSSHFLDGRPGALLDLLEGLFGGVLELQSFRLRLPPSVRRPLLVRGGLVCVVFVCSSEGNKIANNGQNPQV